MTTTNAAITHGLFHLAIKTADLGRTRAFWTGVIGLREIARPDFGYPGAWLACGQPGGQAIIHVYAGLWVRGSMGAMMKGTVTYGWARKHHPRWFKEEIRKGQQ